MPMTLSPTVTFVNVKEKLRNVMRCHKTPSKIAKSLTSGALILWGRSRLQEGTSTYSWLKVQLVEHKAYWALKHTNFDIQTAGDHRKVQLKDHKPLRERDIPTEVVPEVVPDPLELPHGPINSGDGSSVGTLNKCFVGGTPCHVRAVGQDVAYAMPWTALKRMITDKYCPRGEIKKLESEYWNLKVRGTDLMTYNQRFQELALMCDRMFPEESAKVERYVGGLPDMIHGSVKASKPQSMQEAIEFATEMMDKKMLTAAERQAENKRKFEDTSRNNQNQQQPFKRNNVARAYTAGPGDKKPYGGTKPLCTKCNYHHDGPCTQKCTNCKKIGHSARDCKGRPTANNNNNNNNNNNQRTQGTNPRGITCFECGVQGHFRSDCPKLKNGNQGNQTGNGNVVARAYVVGSAGTNPNSNVVTGTFLLNNRYASILFDTGADKSFISTTFSSLMDIIPTTLDHGYDVELADDSSWSSFRVSGDICFTQAVVSSVAKRTLDASGNVEKLGITKRMSCGSLHRLLKVGVHFKSSNNLQALGSASEIKCGEGEPLAFSGARAAGTLTGSYRNKLAGIGKGTSSSFKPLKQIVTCFFVGGTLGGSGSFTSAETALNFVCV
ncbi:putative reverse transcriptase domain-containing protein [Tanacetum coccineum]